MPRYRLVALMLHIAVQRARVGLLLIAGMLLTVVAVCSTPASCWAAPQIGNLSMRGLTIGAKTRIVVSGSDLLEEPRIITEAPLISQTVAPGGAANRFEVEIEVAAKASPGVYELRVATRSGISNAVAISVDHLRHTPFAEKTTALPASLHGQVSGSTIAKTTFQGAKGQRILLDVEAIRLGSKLRPVVRLLDEVGRQLVWSGGRAQLGGDARCSFVLPADGEYTVAVHDLLYKGAGPGFFCLKIGDLRTADVAFPPGVQRGVSTKVRLLSSVSSPISLTNTEVNVASLADQVSATLPRRANVIGVQPRLMLSDHPEVLEDERGGAAQEIGAVPVAVSGRLMADEVNDEFTVSVKPGAKLRVEVYAHRLGSTLDTVLKARDPSGKQLAMNDDQANTVDPGFNLDIPQGVEKVVLSLSKLQRSGGQAAVYRIEILDRTRPDFTLSLANDRFNLPAGATQVVRVTAQRKRYGGPIDLSVPGLPEGVKLSGGRIPAGETIGLLTLTAPSDQGAAGVTNVVGRAAAPNVTVVRTAKRADSAAAKTRPWSRERIGWAVAKPAPISIAWAEGAPPAELFLGVKNPVAFRLTGAEGVKGKIRIRMLTSQVTPKKKVKQGNRDVNVDDVERTLRLDGSPTFDAAAEGVDAIVQVIAPADLASKSWSTVFVAELLAADNKTVVASVTTQTCQVGVQTSLKVELAGEPKVEAKAGIGETGVLKGAITRLAGLSTPVTVTLVGLPKEYPAPKVEIAADATEFTLPVAFPFGSKAGPLKNVKLVATALPNPENKALVLRSKETPVGVNVVAGEKPPAEPEKEKAPAESK